jgi:hypothetical protein
MNTKYIFFVLMYEVPMNELMDVEYTYLLTYL